MNANTTSRQRGRPPGKSRLTEMVGALFTASEKAALMRYAQRRGTTMSALLRALAVREIGKDKKGNA